LVQTDHGPDVGVDSPMAPPVVAVVVAHDPGPWFDETVASLAGQDYPNLSILVIDAASETEIKPRVGRSAPGAFVRRIESNPGYGAAANEVLDVVDGAAFYLLCHDDIAPDPDAVRLLVEEAYRSNAAIVGPKLVRWDDPRRLLQLGEGIDHSGYSVPLVDVDELDQEQHDAVRDVFTVPGACTLVRADLFSEIGGFDEGIDYLGDDLSLCWRAHIAGARVIVAPDARVRHRQALDRRRPIEVRRLRARHRIRVLLSSYSVPALVVALPRMAVLTTLEVVYTLLVGRTRHARDLISAWTWNLRRLDELRGARRQVKQFRRASDSEVREDMVRGNARIRQFLRGQLGGGEAVGGLAGRGRDAADALTSGTLRVAASVWAVVGLVLLVGSRHLITRGLPSVGELVPFRTGPVDLLREWASGWRANGLGSESPNPTLFGAVGLLGAVFAGAMGLLRTVLTLGLLPLGAAGAYRLARPIGSRHAQIAALLVYVANPLPYDALAEGRWGVLALYAAGPPIVGLLARAAGVAPFGSAEGAIWPRLRVRGAGQLVLAVGVVTALVAMVLPSVVVVVPGIALALAVGSALAYRGHGSARMVGVAIGGAAVAVLLQLPWSLDFLLPGTTASSFTGVPAPSHGTGLADLLRFHVGPTGGGALGWALLVGAALPLLIGSGERHAWAVRGWTLAVASWGAAWLSLRGDLPFPLPAPDVLLVPAAVGLAISTAMGVAAFQHDLPGYRFGWRQVASGVAAAAVGLATLPILGASFNGGWAMPAGDHARALRFLDAENDEHDFRTLWLGDPSALPLGGWRLTDGLAYATTDGGTPRLEDLLVGSDDGSTGLIADAVDLARTGQTARLGRLLAPMGIQYVVVVQRLAPAPFSTAPRPTPRGFLATLDAQLDLEPLDVPAGLTVYRNQAAFPVRAAVPADSDPPIDGGISDAASVDLSSADPVLEHASGTLGWRGSVPSDSQVLIAQSHSSHWELEVDGHKVDEGQPFGWATGFEVTDGGPASLRYRTSPLRWGLIAIEVLGWMLALRTLLRIRLDPGLGAGAAEAAPPARAAVASWGGGDDEDEGDDDGGGDG
jgi:GT2 family glycosyltransferase